MNSLDRFISSATSPFYNHKYYNLDHLDSRISNNKNNVFNKNLIVDITKDEIEIPVICRRDYEEIIIENLPSKDIEKIVTPLYISKDYLLLKTFNGVIKKSFDSYNNKLILNKIITTKNDIYYGGFGLILDNSLEPLMMCSLKARPKENKLEYYKMICRVSPKVFAEPTKLINKGIISKLIPLYTNNNIWFPAIDKIFRFTTINMYVRVEVIINDFNEFFTTPVAPTPGKSNSADFNKCLNDNIEDILDF